jgi:exosortase/archaeosortase family protein
VGIDDACSGIRSLQAAFMISLFLGELYRLTRRRRLALCGAGFAFAFLFNVGRTFLLVQVAARQGIPAIARWHDPAGVTILVGCFLCLWLAALALKRQEPSAKSEEQSAHRPLPLAPCLLPLPLTLFFGCLALWLLAAEVGVELWYRAHERGLERAETWRAQLPVDNPTARAVPLPEEQRCTLRCDEYVKGSWEGPGRLAWHLIYLRWKPGRVAAHQAQGHVPEGCLAAAGKEVTILETSKWLEVKGARLPFRVYRVVDQGGAFFVFHCVWQDQTRGQGFEQREILSRAGRLANVWAGRRNLGQRSLEIGLWGADDPAAAEAALRIQLDKLLLPDR